MSTYQSTSAALSAAALFMLDSLQAQAETVALGGALDQPQFEAERLLLADLNAVLQRGRDAVHALEGAPGEVADAVLLELMTALSSELASWNDDLGRSPLLDAALPGDGSPLATDLPQAGVNAAPGAR
ncbi:hypothetical protein GXW83_28280 [Streptacidiphilus sp. PB12-B1b]|uniref:hypothetical protein n=1 Tax=Streptacidiphilus sp. PB12-B1b TaxID=2705012 RepID=UPI0015F976EB|nr:hypothetical protein [Streptacidiphilus sp. PB12-B1b]QMU79024.1 hypothetical protein GXW83_28280 [Streptacidiphilus sp. PB12-B1b]